MLTNHSKSWALGMAGYSMLATEISGGQMEEPLSPYMGHKSINLDVFIDWMFNSLNAIPLCCDASDVNHET